MLSTEWRIEDGEEEEEKQTSITADSSRVRLVE